jgi:MFS transporter, putative metabolite:H+ symporter
VSSPQESARSSLTPYQRKLFFFLSVATFFEGFDYIALTQLLKPIREEFGLDYGGGQFLVSVINVGAIAAYALIRHADVAGRRRVLSITIAGYTMFSLLSAFANSAWSFGALQFAARAFLLAEYAVSMVYVVEEFPADRRAFATGVIQGVNSLGSIVCAGVVPLLIKLPWGFRTVYLVGGVPLLLVMFLRRGIRDTQRFLERETQPPTSLFRIFRTPYWRRLPLLASIWALTYLCTYVLVNNFKDYAVLERGFDDVMVSRALVIAALGSMPLVFMSGKLLDLIGRKPGAAVIFSITSLSTWFAFTTHGFWPITLGLTGCIFVASATLPVLNSITLELFPTEVRADGYAWSNNLLGRIGYIAGPSLVGLMAPELGIGHATALMGVFPLLALGLILWRVPETKGKELEEIAALH